MSTIGKLKYDDDTGCHTCKHILGTTTIRLYLDATEGSVPVDRLKEIAQGISDDWEKRHSRLSKLVAQELVSSRELKNALKLRTGDCVPFYLRVEADSDGEINYTAAFKVPALLRKDEYVDVQEEISGQWVNTEVCCTE
jgi:hypothetical protein